MLAVNDNKLTRAIPSDIGKLKKLEQVDFSSNAFTEMVPSSLGNLSKLSWLYLQNNKFHGAIPSTLGNCRNLLMLSMENNDLNGTIPNSLFEGLTGLVQLGLARNHLEGPLPFEVSKLMNLELLEVFDNNLSGEIPSGLASCSGLFFLRLQGNSFQSPIPTSLISLKSLQMLDLSQNNFTGGIPKFFCQLPLAYLNLSFNYFEGEVPTKGVFTNMSAVSVVGNRGLCGGIPELNLPRCIRKVKHTKRSRKISHRWKLIISFLSLLLVGLVIMSSLCWIFSRRKRSNPTSPESLQVETFLKVSYKMLLEATNGFSNENLLGVGAYGSVFKGILKHDQMTILVAVKVLDLDNQGASKSFMAECVTLKNTRHRNLLHIRTVCSSIDFQGKDFKALVYEFMPGGSLERWLHSGTEDEEKQRVRLLNFVERVSVAVDVACALDYLHNERGNPIVHCDLKPSNVLLDDEMVAHVGDFGLARFLLQPEAAQCQSSSSVVRGTLGYAAPEYGLGSKPSPAGDAYSYGILLLEMMTGKRPTDSIFTQGLELHTYAKRALLDYGQVLQIADPRILEDVVGCNGTGHSRIECMMSVIKVGVACSVEFPQDRMTVREATVELQKVRAILQDLNP